MTNLSFSSPFHSAPGHYPEGGSRTPGMTNGEFLSALSALEVREFCGQAEAAELKSNGYIDLLSPGEYSERRQALYQLTEQKKGLEQLKRRASSGCETDRACSLLVRCAGPLGEELGGVLSEMAPRIIESAEYEQSRRLSAVLGSAASRVIGVEVKKEIDRDGPGDLLRELKALFGIE